MSVSGFDLTATTGAPVPRTINEIEQTAAKAIGQINLNIRPGVDSVDTALQTSIHPSEWKYSANAARPLLPPVNTMRVRTAGEDPQLDESWKGKFDELVNTLPTDLREFLTLLLLNCHILSLIHHL